MAEPTFPSQYFLVPPSSKESRNLPEAIFVRETGIVSKNIVPSCIFSHRAKETPSGRSLTLIPFKRALGVYHDSPSSESIASPCKEIEMTSPNSSVYSIIVFFANK
jgi:hypothetical protein